MEQFNVVSSTPAPGSTIQNSGPLTTHCWLSRPLNKNEERRPTKTLQGLDDCQSFQYKNGPISNKYDSTCIYHTYDLKFYSENAALNILRILLFSQRPEWDDKHAHTGTYMDPLMSTLDPLLADCYSLLVAISMGSIQSTLKYSASPSPGSLAMAINWLTFCGD